MGHASRNRHYANSSMNTATGANPYISHPSAFMADGFGQPGSTDYMQQNSSLFGSSTTDQFVKGAAVGAVAALLLSNESVQKFTMGSLAKVWTMLQGGMEELKEKFEDAKAELDAQD